MLEVKSVENIRYIFGVSIPIRNIDPVKLAGYILNGKAEGEYSEYRSILDGKLSEKAKRDVVALYHVDAYGSIEDLHNILVADDKIVMDAANAYRKSEAGARVIDMANAYEEDIFQSYTEKFRYIVGIEMPKRPWETTAPSEEEAVSQIVNLAKSLAYDSFAVPEPELMIISKMNE